MRQRTHGGSAIPDDEPFQANRPTADREHAMCTLTVQDCLPPVAGADGDVPVDAESRGPVVHTIRQDKRGFRRIEGYLQCILSRLNVSKPPVPHRRAHHECLCGAV